VLRIWVIVLRREVLWLGWLFDTPLIVPTVFHVPINGLGAWQKRVCPRDRVWSHDCVDDQSLGRSCGWFLWSRVPKSRDPKGTDLSRDVSHAWSHAWTRDRSADTFPGSRAWGVTLTMWLYIGLGGALGGLGFGISCWRVVTDFVRDSIPSLGFHCACNVRIPSLGFCLERNSCTNSLAWVNSLAGTHVRSASVYPF